MQHLKRDATEQRHSRDDAGRDRWVMQRALVIMALVIGPATCWAAGRVLTAGAASLSPQAAIVRRVGSVMAAVAADDVPRIQGQLTIFAAASPTDAFKEMAANISLVGFAAIEPEFEEAAAIDGASAWTTF
jgi:hypothetical protein